MSYWRKFQFFLHSGTTSKKSKIVSIKRITITSLRKWYFYQKKHRSVKQVHIHKIKRACSYKTVFISLYFYEGFQYRKYMMVIMKLDPEGLHRCPYLIPFTMTVLNNEYIREKLYKIE